MHKQHPQTAYRKDAVLIGTILKIAINKNSPLSSARQRAGKDKADQTFR